MNKFITFESIVLIACFTADRQWFNTAAPQIGMQILISILKKKNQKENNLSVIMEDKKPNQEFFSNNDVGLS